MVPDLDSVIEDYLEAYRGYQKFLKASETLYVVFAKNWGGPSRHCAEAFAAFTENLRKEWAYKHLEVTEVYPNRNPNPE